MIFEKKSKFHDEGGPDTVVSPSRSCRAGTCSGGSVRGVLQSLLSMAGEGLSRDDKTVFYRFQLGNTLRAGCSSRLHCTLHCFGTIRVLYPKDNMYTRGV